LPAWRKIWLIDQSIKNNLAPVESRFRNISGLARMPKLGMEPIRRKALIAAAIEAIHAHGMAQVTMGDIAGRAGVSAGLAHHYFGGKNQLLLATMRYLLSELGGEIQARLAEAKIPPDRIRAVVRGNFAACQFRPAVVSAWLAFYVAAQNDPEARRLLRVYARRLESNLLHALRELTGGENAARIAEMAAALIDGLWIRRSLFRQNADPDSAVELVEQAIFSALDRPDA
jgi:TetR/AcrR family transcriptional repressor of bet genes